VFSSEASTVHFYRIKMGRIENAERAEMVESGGKWREMAGNGGKWREMAAAVDYFSFPTDRGDWN
jgi:hypothetical protein